MNLQRAFSFIFDDPRWTEKIVVLIGFALFGIIPILGLAAIAVMLGYMADLSVNVMREAERPLPRWLRIDEKLGRGAAIMAAVVIYNLPLVLIGGCMATVPGMFRDEMVSGSVSLLFLLCFTPLVLGYTFVAWSTLAIGYVHYAQSEDTNDLYRFGRWFKEMRARLPVVAQWATLATIVNVVMGILLLIPCLGWLIILGLMIPVQGHLLGQFGLRMGIKAPKIRSTKV